MIKKLVREKEIHNLYHFTQRDNLKSILKNGIVPLAKHPSLGIKANTNDLYRYDGCEDASSISISFPNYKMFYPLRLNNKKVQWIVIALYRRILWEKDCAFCYTNAGNSEISTIPINQRKSVYAFKKMFEDTPYKPMRDELSIPKNYPTDPQAEVLVFDDIEPCYIKGIACNSTFSMNKINKNYDIGEIEVKVCKNLFNGRVDYMHWRKAN